MDYVEQNLRKEEKIIKRAEINWLVIFSSIIGLIIMEIVFLLFSKFFIDFILGVIPESAGQPTPEEREKVDMIISLILWVIRIPAYLGSIISIINVLGTKLAITDKRVLGKIGVLGVRAIDFPIDKIDNVSYSAGLLGRIFKYYTVQITGTSGDKYMMRGIKNAVEFRNAVTSAIDESEQRARVEQAEQIAEAMSKKVNN